jgi:hypothetical protein
MRPSIRETTNVSNPIRLTVEQVCRLWYLLLAQAIVGFRGEWIENSTVVVLVSCVAEPAFRNKRVWICPDAL